MKKKLYVVGLFILVIIFSIILYLNLSFEIIRRSDIKKGNELIEKIETYKISKNRLPENNDYKTLEELGFEMKLLGTRPSYTKADNEEYEIGYFDGLDGPYLMWNSRERVWKMGYPELFQ